MRHHPSQPATIGTTLDAGLDLTGACTACHRVVIVDTEALEALALRYGRDAVLPDLMQRITCKACGAKARLSVHAPSASKAR
jgi:hypothetical protein